MNLRSDPQDVVPVIQRPEYTVSYEQANADSTYIHCTIHVPWTGRVRRMITEDWKLLRSLRPDHPFYAIVAPDDVKLQHFCQLLDMKPQATLCDLSTGRTNFIYRN